jgi:hypothetical protein
MDGMVSTEKKAISSFLGPGIVTSRVVAGPSFHRSGGSPLRALEARR